MWIVRIALSRPYTFIVLALLILLLSPVVILRTPTDIFPSINIPVVAVAWTYTGLNPEEMEGRITTVYERALTTTVDNIEHIESTTVNGTAIVKIYLQPNASIDRANAQVSTSPSVVNERESANQPYFPASQANNGTGALTLPFDLSYEVDLWGRVRRTVSASREETQASAADLQTASLSLHAELAADYFELRSADAQKQLLDDTVKAYTGALQLTQNLFEGGAAPKSDVAQAQTQLDGAQVEDTDVTVMRAQYEHAIATLIGKPPAEFSISFAPQTPLRLPVIPVGLPTTLLERRPDIAAGEPTSSCGSWRSCS